MPVWKKSRETSPVRLNASLDSRITRPLVKHVGLVKVKRFSAAAFQLLLLKGRSVNAEDAIPLLEEEKRGSQTNTARAARYNGRLLLRHALSVLRRLSFPAL